MPRYGFQAHAPHFSWKTLGVKLTVFYGWFLGKTKFEKRHAVEGVFKQKHGGVQGRLFNF